MTNGVHARCVRILLEEWGQGCTAANVGRVLPAPCMLERIGAWHEELKTNIGGAQGTSWRLLQDECEGKTNTELEVLVPHIRRRKTCETNEMMRLTLHFADGGHLRMVLAVLQRNGGAWRRPGAHRGA